MDSAPQPTNQPSPETAVTPDHIAFRGEVEVLNATWSLDEGRMIELRLCGEAYDRKHPFKQYQQRRNGRMGTRFRAAFAKCATGEPLANMDLMLASWKDTSRTGQSIRLWIDNEVDVHPFSGCARRQGQNPGDIFAVVMVELSDDDSPINQAQRQGVESGIGIARANSTGTETAQNAGTDHVQKGRPVSRGANKDAARKPRALSSTAHLLVTSALFVRFLTETKSELVPQWTPEKAREYVKAYLKVQSLSELDTDRKAAMRWEKVRQAYDLWYRQEPAP